MTCFHLYVVASMANEVEDSLRMRKENLGSFAFLFSVHHLRPRKGTQCQFKLTGKGILFICDIVIRCFGTLKPGLSLDQLQQI